MTDYKRNQYSIALNGQGYILKGTPSRISRIQEQSPIYENRFAFGDRGFGDFSYRWFWAQESFVGMKNQDWQDDGKIQYSTNLNLSQMENKDPYMERQATLKNTFSATNFAYITSVGLSETNTLYVGLKGNATYHPAVYYTTDGTNFTLCTEFGGTIWANGEQITSIVSVGSNRIITADSGNDGSFCNENGGTITDITTNVRTSAPYTCTKGWLYAFLFQTHYALFDNGSILYCTTSTDGTTFTNAFGGSNYLSNLTLEGGDFKYFATKAKYYILGTDYTTQSKAVLYEWDGTAVIPTAIYTWTGYKAGQTYGAGKSLYEYKNKLYIVLKNINTGKSEIWSMNSSGTLSKEYISTVTAENAYTSLKTDFQYGFVESNGLLYLTGAVTDGTYWWGGNLATTNGFAPLAATKLTDDSIYYLWGTSSSGTGNNLYLDKLDLTTGTAYAYLETNPFYASLPNTDKIWFNLTLNFDTFVSGSEIKVEYNIGNGFITLETINYTTQGAINNYTFDFSTNTISKKLILRFSIKGYSTILQNYTISYLPSTYAKYRWRVTVILMDNLISLDGNSKEPKRAETLRNVLKNDYYTKNALSFQDIDYAETTLTDNPLSATATTVNVVSTANFPEQGRIKIDNEEILYTGKTATTFTGCTRNVRGTTGVSHTTGTSVHNGYNVLISDYSEETPIGAKPIIEEAIVSLSLSEI